MGDTSITVGEDTKERLGDHRAPTHDSWSDVLDGMMEILPTVQDVEEGCEHCGEVRPHGRAVEDAGGAVQFFHAEYEDNDVYGSRYFCSAECAHDAQQEVEAMVPSEPDEVLVGGDAEPQAHVEGAVFYIDGHTREVSLPTPGAFGGTDSHGNEYDYEGEPVYIRNNGDIVQDGVVDDIIHEDAATALLLGRDHETVMSNHPDDEKREE
jgi:hypothetical protein